MIPRTRATKAKGAKNGAGAVVPAGAKALPVRRRDATGHLDPRYAADLRARSLAENPQDNKRAFLTSARSSDSLSEGLGEEWVAAATSGEDDAGEVRDQRVPEEVGGPFVITSGSTEFAPGIDESNPVQATREPFPKT
ncbi:MAG TPA: hypothetical protein VGI39_19285 [Polyangiaceae bacterium]|jgi:hypothetical protein